MTQELFLLYGAIGLTVISGFVFFVFARIYVFDKRARSSSSQMGEGPFAISSIVFTVAILLTAAAFVNISSDFPTQYIHPQVTTK